MCQLAIVAASERRAQRLVEGLRHKGPYQARAISEVELKAACCGGSLADLWIVDIETVEQAAKHRLEWLGRVSHPPHRAG